jgi:hypothetical protein
MSDSDKNKERIAPVVRENYLDFLYDLYRSGIDITPENKALLEKNGYIKIDVPEPKKEVSKDYINRVLLEKSTQKQLEIDRKIDILSSSENDNKFEIVIDGELEERRLKGGYVFESRETPITKKDWMPDSISEHSPEFIEFILSIIDFGFQNKKGYRKLNLYVQQAYTWQSEKTDYLGMSEGEREDFLLRELDRCDQNSLYFLNTYF